MEIIKNYNMKTKIAAIFVFYICFISSACTNQGCQKEHVLISNELQTILELFIEENKDINDSKHKILVTIPLFDSEINRLVVVSSIKKESNKYIDTTYTQFTSIYNFDVFLSGKNEFFVFPYDMKKSVNNKCIDSSNIYISNYDGPIWIISYDKKGNVINFKYRFCIVNQNIENLVRSL